MQASLGYDYSKQLKAAAVIVFTFILLLLPVVGMIVATLVDRVVIERPGIINSLSVLLFIGLSLPSLFSERLYYLLLPFMLLAFPAAVDDFFPAIYLGTAGEWGAAAFPFITHIDVFLLLGIANKLHNQKSFRIKVSGLMVVVLVLFLLSSIANVLFSNDIHKTGLLILGLYPMRYLVLLIILLSNVDILKYEKPIIYSLMFSVFFLLVEAWLNTRMTGSDVLSSGSLGSNTFANVTCGLLILFIYLKRNKFGFPPLVFIGLLVSCAMIILLTETRIAIVAGIASFLIIQVYYYNFLRSFIVILFTGLLVSVVYLNIDVPERYSVERLTSKVKFNHFSLNPAEMITIELSQETSSVHSRLKLYGTAFKMIEDNPVFGTGYGTFNYVKNDYGFDEKILIDAHNGYLNTLSQLGLSGIPFLFLIYFAPFFAFRKIPYPTFLKFLFVVNITIAIADITNAGIYKHSVFAILAFCTVVTIQLSREANTRAKL